jgi:hypothetical protein
MTCDILDIRCMLVNEIIGDTTLTVVLGAIVYFWIAVAFKWSWNVTFIIGLPFILALASVLYGFTAIYTIMAVVVGIFAALAMLRLIGNK